jgi:mono/diheme cytochrome c family protein
VRRLLVSALAAAGLLGGCDLSMTHQARYQTEAQADLWGDDMAARRPPEGAVAQDAELRAQADMTPPLVTPAVLERGRDRYQVYCTPCHGVAGAGDGKVIARGFSAPPDLNSAGMRAAPARRLYEAIGDGYGAMYPFGDRIAPADRWAVVAYLRALQVSRGGRS